MRRASRSEEISPPFLVRFLCIVWESLAPPLPEGMAENTNAGVATSTLTRAGERPEKAKTTGQSEFTVGNRKEILEKAREARSRVQKKRRREFHDASAASRERERQRRASRLLAEIEREEAAFQEYGEEQTRYVTGQRLSIASILGSESPDPEGGSLPKIRVGIHGWDRPGRMAARVALETERVMLVAIHRTSGSEDMTLQQMVQLFMDDGPWDPTIRVMNDAILFGTKYVSVLTATRRTEDEVDHIPWWDVAGARYVIETDSSYSDNLQTHFLGGAHKVISCINSSALPMFIMGINHNEYTPNIDILSIGEPLYHCFAPLAKVINDKFGIALGHVTAVFPDVHHDSLNIFPMRSLRSTMDVQNYLPVLDSRLTGVTFYTPARNYSTYVQLSVMLQNDATYAQIKDIIRQESNGELNGILGFRDDSIMSSYLIGDKRSCIFDAQAGTATSNRFFNLIAWCDMDWGFWSRMMDFISYIDSHRI